MSGRTTTQTAEGDGNTLVSAEEFHVHVSNISSIVAEALKDIAKISSSDDDGSNDTVAFGIDEKIEYNCVNTFREILDEYGQYGGQIDALYDEYDNNKPGFKKAVFKYFKNKYLLKKEKLRSADPKADPMSVIKANSDEILRDISEQFRADLKTANNLKLSIEELDTCVLAITCHAFIQCKILEKPPK